MFDHSTPSNINSTPSNINSTPPQQLRIFEEQPPLQKSKTSYTGYAKSAVLSQWQKCLQKQQFEEACHWTTEMDASGWQDEIWQKLILYASKHVHLHCPKLPSLMARNFAFYNLYVTKHFKTRSLPQHQPRNNSSLRQNMCQMIGLVTLSSKGPVYALPQIDIFKVNEADLVTGTHAWLMPHKTNSDNTVVVQMLSTIMCHVEAKSTHKVIYWMSVLVEYDKHQKKNKTPVTMTPRKPLLPDDSFYKHVYLDNAHACDWVWLMWSGLAQASIAFHRHPDCLKAIKGLSYLFAVDYTTSKRNARMPILIHALELVCAEADWTSSVYASVDEMMIEKACMNIHVMYTDIMDKRLQLVQHQLTTTSETTAQVCNNNASSNPQTKETKQQTKETKQPMLNKPCSKPNTNRMSIDSSKKIDIFNAIDDVFLK